MIDSVQVTTGADATIRVALHGAIVFGNADETRAEISRQVEEAAPRHVRLDLSDVTFLDSSGVAVLIVTRRLAQRLNADCLIDDASPAVLEHLRLAGLTHLFGLRGVERRRSRGRAADDAGPHPVAAPEAPDDPPRDEPCTAHRSW
jgi:anti-anti-sigma factor